MLIENQLYCEDCLVTMKKMPDQYIDLVVTSPLYDDLRDYGGYKFDFDNIVKELFRVLKVGGVVVWVVADSVFKGSESLTSFKQAIRFTEEGFRLHDTMTYEKLNFSNPSSNRYHQIFEYMFIFSRGKPKTFNPICDRPVKYSKPLGAKTIRQKDGSQKVVESKLPTRSGMRTNIWRMKTAGQEKVCKSIAHPAKFPDELARAHILSWSNEDDLVYDPFAGSGTTGRMAHELGRAWLMSEINKEYCEDIIHNSI